MSQAAMPPGWIRTVNSACLLDSFSVVDKVTYQQSRSIIAKTCQACAKQINPQHTDDQGSISMGNIFTRIVNECHRGEELVKILLFCKYLSSQRNQHYHPSFCSELLSSSWSQLMSSPSPYLVHLLHFTREELTDLCRPRKGMLVS